MIHFSDAPPAPTQLKVLLSGEARKEHSKFIGTYTLQRSPINGNPWWKQGLFRKKVVWFHDLGFWTFTDFEDLGKSNTQLLSLVALVMLMNGLITFLMVGDMIQRETLMKLEMILLLKVHKLNHCCNNFKITNNLQFVSQVLKVLPRK